MRLTIAIAAHKAYSMPDDPCYLPVHVGAALASNTLGFARDDTGENISDKNRGFCELTGLYWLWKNPPDADFLGLVHYRRHFRGRQGIARADELADILKTTDGLLPKPRRYWIETNRSQYVHAHHAEDLDLTRAILAERHPEFLPAFDAVMAETSGHRFNMFVLRRPLFFTYCAWLFDILFELERRLDISTYSAYDRRVFGFVGERLLDVYLRTKGIRTAELPVLNLESQHWPRKIAAFLWRKFFRARGPSPA